MKLGLVQMAMAPEPEANRERASEAVRQAADAGANVIILPELFHARYFCRQQDTANFDLAETLDGPSVMRMRSLAATLKTVIVVPYFERRAPGLYHNSAAVIDADGSVLGHYRKLHIPQDPGFEEKFYFTPGDLGPKTFRTRHGTLGVLICWDQWFPEAARLTALAGAEVLIYPTAIGWLPSEKAALGQAQHTAWETVQRGHAVSNGCYVCAVNRTGTEPDPRGGEPIEFWGQSFVANPYGEVTHRCASTEAETVVVDCDLAQVEAFRRIWPFFRDRRIDAYSGLCKRFAD